MHFLLNYTIFMIFVFGINLTNSFIITKIDEDINQRPIIGILTQEVSRFIQRTYSDKEYQSYVAASYIKFVEGAGALPVPIWIGQPREYYEELVPKLNGILLPGGATFFNQSEGYADAGAHIYDIAIDLNNNGYYLPLWGTCLGFELLTYLSDNKSDHRSYCRSTSQSLPLEFKEGFKSSKLFGSAPDDVIKILQTEPVTPNFHQFCVTEKTLQETGLDKIWSVLSVNHDWDGFEFISTIEHVQYPFYGTQFHPEKNIYEFVRNRNISHSPSAIRASQYFANFFVNESRKNLNHFDSYNDEQNHLIYNYEPTFSARNGSSFEQIYLFEKSGSNIGKQKRKKDKMKEIKKQLPSDYIENTEN